MTTVAEHPIISNSALSKEKMQNPWEMIGLWSVLMGLLAIKLTNKLGIVLVTIYAICHHFAFPARAKRGQTSTQVWEPIWQVSGTPVSTMRVILLLAGWQLSVFRAHPALPGLEPAELLNSSVLDQVGFERVLTLFLTIPKRCLQPLLESLLWKKTNNLPWAAYSSALPVLAERNNDSIQFPGLDQALSLPLRLLGETRGEGVRVNSAEIKKKFLKGKKQ